MFETLFPAYPWTVHKGRELPKEFKRFLSDPELNAEALGGHVHWTVLAEPLGVTLAGLAACFGIITFAPADAAALSSFATLGITALLLYFAWHFIEWRRDLIFITNKRVITVTGVIARNVAMMPLNKMTDMSYVQSIPGIILGYGRFRLETAGQNQAVEMLRRVPEPDFTYRYIQNLVFGRGTTDVILVDVKTDKKVNVNWRGKVVPSSPGRPASLETAEDEEWYES